MHDVELWALIPFVLMLLCIAICPLVCEHWWENNRNKLLVSGVLGVPTAIYLLLNGMGHNLEHQMLFDYVPFIILLGALFVVTGGICISGDIKAKPSINTAFLAIGFVLASIMGTTGAAMLLIRPLINTNAERKHKVHTILFFIAIVANCGGLLTPLGDPPLFLLYLRGAPFEWFFNLAGEWLFAGVLLLIIYYIFDSFYYSKEDAQSISLDNANVKPIRLSGKINLIYLLGVIASVAFINPSFIPEMGNPESSYLVKYYREIALCMLIVLSLVTTKKSVREANKYSWAPIVEVAFLFVGIFVTMTPALLFLNTHAASLGLTEPWQFFYSAGSLSSFLDNAPTAVAFHTVAAGLPESAAAASAGIVDGTLQFNGMDIPFIASIPEMLLKAISIGAVFFGAMTYIGNGPNFMVKAIAEENGIKMPSFFAYMYKFSLMILLPIYILVQLIFL